MELCGCDWPQMGRAPAPRSAVQQWAHTGCWQRLHARSMLVCCPRVPPASPACCRAAGLWQAGCGEQCVPRRSQALSLPPAGLDAGLPSCCVGPAERWVAVECCEMWCSQRGAIAVTHQPAGLLSELYDCRHAGPTAGTRRITCSRTQTLGAGCWCMVDQLSLLHVCIAAARLLHARTAHGVYDPASVHSCLLPLSPQTQALHHQGGVVGALPARRSVRGARLPIYMPI